MYGFSDLEDRLLGVDGVSALRQALDSVRAIAGDVQTGVAAGMSHGDFAQARKVLAAAAAAETILLKAANPKGV